MEETQQPGNSDARQEDGSRTKRGRTGGAEHDRMFNKPIWIDRPEGEVDPSLPRPSSRSIDSDSYEPKHSARLEREPENSSPVNDVVREESRQQRSEERRPSNARRSSSQGHPQPSRRREGGESRRDDSTRRPSARRRDDAARSGDRRQSRQSTGRPSERSRSQVRTRGSERTYSTDRARNADRARTSRDAASGGRPRVNQVSHNYTPRPRQIELEPARKRNRLIAFGAVAVVLIVAVAVGVTSLVHKDEASTDAGSGTTTSQTSQTDQGQSSSSASAKTTSGEDPSLAWRDEDFPVDPNKTTWSDKSNGHKTIYLTIDDGPSENTEKVLDILDKYNAKATFFVVGHNDDYFPMIAEAYRRGHTIGLHTMSHDYAEVYASTDAYFADLDAIGQVVKEQIGYVPCFIRFPGGSSNAVSASYAPGIMTELTQMVQDKGYQYWDWNVSSGDGSDHTTEELIGFSTEPHEEENIVFLCHDSATKQTTVEALPSIIEHYQSLGYSFEALDRDSWVCHHGVNN